MLPISLATQRKLRALTVRQLDWIGQYRAICSIMYALGTQFYLVTERATNLLLRLRVFSGHGEGE